MGDGERKYLISLLEASSSCVQHQFGEDSIYLDPSACHSIISTPAFKSKTHFQGPFENTMVLLEAVGFGIDVFSRLLANTVSCHFSKSREICYS